MNQDKTIECEHHRGNWGHGGELRETCGYKHTTRIKDLACQLMQNSKEFIRATILDSVGLDERTD